MKKKLNLLCILLVVVISGCASNIAGDRANKAMSGPNKEIHENEIKAYAKRQTKALVFLKEMTGQANPTPDQYIAAGLQFADAACSDYLESLYWVNKNLKADTSQINSYGTLVSGLMGIAKSAASEIAAVAVLFGTAEESMNIYGSRILFELEPSAIRSLVKGSQKAFRSALPKEYKTKTGAFTVIQEYISLCLPSTIEAEINNAAKSAVQVAVTGNAETGEAPRVSINPAQVNAKPNSYASDVYSLLLKAYAFPAGVKRDDAHSQLETWMKSKGVNVHVGVFLMQNQYQEKWRLAVEFLRINGKPKLE